MFCQNCGAQLEEQDKFCGNCGTPVRGMDNEKKQENMGQPEERMEFTNQPEERMEFANQPADGKYKKNTRLLITLVLVVGVLTFLILAISIFVWGSKAGDKLEKGREERYERQEDEEDFWDSDEEFDEDGDFDSEEDEDGDFDSEEDEDGNGYL